MMRISAQDQIQSIHSEQQSHYRQFGNQSRSFYDSLSGFKAKSNYFVRSDCQLNRVVFGFHPYWAGSDYLEYQWNLLSDLCYFSYEVNPSNGEAENYHGWLTDPAIDSAQAHGVKVHLCATIFSGHTGFFTNMTARQTLISNLVSLVQQRNADGINMDIEAMPSSVSDSVVVFMHDLSVQLKAVLPEAKVSIDLPAVNWGNDFQVAEMNNWVDWFFVMGYDYYWNSSPQAGPVSPLYSMTSGNDISLARTISDYEATGLEPGKFILGMPYYGRQWRTQYGSIPSPILATGTAMTYAAVRNNSGTYNASNFTWEPNSLSSCYIFFQNDSWYQCFIGLDRDLRKKYDIVNYRDLAGIGIWALGYDNGYNELWQAISDKFTDCYIPLVYDTIYDSGGPAWNYYVNEDYIMTIDHGFSDSRYLSFSGFSLEAGYDSLWLFAGPDTTFSFLGGFSGQENPGTFTSGNGAFTLKFKSDGMQNASGWRAVYHNGSLGVNENKKDNEDILLIYPNPAGDYITVEVTDDDSFVRWIIVDITGKVVLHSGSGFKSYKHRKIKLDISILPDGVFSIVIINRSGGCRASKVVKLKQ
jgi:GH18 family chitinase